MRVKCCFTCRVYMPIIEDNPKNLAMLNLFDSRHSGHPVQVVNKEELDNIEAWEKPYRYDDNIYSE